MTFYYSLKKTLTYFVGIGKTLVHNELIVCPKAIMPHWIIYECIFIEYQNVVYLAFYSSRSDFSDAGNLVSKYIIINHLLLLNGFSYRLVQH